MKIIGMILSGGSGQRFGSEIPKQYLDINGRPVISYAAEAFQKSMADEIIIVAGAGYTDRCTQIAEEGNYSKVTAVIEGGSERYYSVLKGLEYLMKKNDEDCVVLIHDGARPFISASTINGVAMTVLKEGAAIAAVPCTDTIKIADEEGNIVSTTRRSLTFAAQTPQGFRLKDIYRAYKEIIGEDRASAGQKHNGSPETIRDRTHTGPVEKQSNAVIEITDDAMVYQMAFPDGKIKIVQSDTTNMKITRARDLDIANLLLISC